MPVLKNEISATSSTPIWQPPGAPTAPQNNTAPSPTPVCPATHAPRPHNVPFQPHPRGTQAQAAQTAQENPQQTSYTSNDVPIPADFLSVPLPEDAPPVTLKTVDWSASALPENGPLYAVVLDNVLTPQECAQLIHMAEDGATDRGDNGDEPWQPAMVNIGPGWEILEPEYRNSDRVIWDQQEVVDRLWERCRLAPGLEEQLREVEGSRKPEKGEETRWVFDRFNKRMRFLKYQKGQFFRPHCDGPYGEEGEDGSVYRTHHTVHLYLNDSVAEVGKDKADLVGGATTFLSADEKRRVDVDPKAGRVLIFQHKRLYHCGDDVVKGTKYTMRTDILYRLVRSKIEAEGDVDGEGQRESA
ncbi:hypothetical protein ColLi_02494 [Colletotrichum liriopes]|uniref:Prolyl 4-hydroxylase alpha subunit domain-containing protein n=1 Tax=Colletotrichum liriopes TaxID=708192 RepID=A0AA37GFV8_9PEZI|nr:hypothetical protein ColLi_02494 [Colletotrichum liriopes]